MLLPLSRREWLTRTGCGFGALALAAALADTTEKFLISKGRLDYGPFSLADVVAQI